MGLVETPFFVWYSLQAWLNITEILSNRSQMLWIRIKQQKWAQISRDSIVGEISLIFMNSPKTLRICNWFCMLHSFCIVFFLFFQLNELSFFTMQKDYWEVSFIATKLRIQNQQDVCNALQPSNIPHPFALLRFFKHTKSVRSKMPICKEIYIFQWLT